VLTGRSDAEEAAPRSQFPYAQVLERIIPTTKYISEGAIRRIFAYGLSILQISNVTPAYWKACPEVGKKVSAHRRAACTEARLTATLDRHAVTATVRQIVAQLNHRRNNLANTIKVAFIDAVASTDASVQRARGDKNWAAAWAPGHAYHATGCDAVHDRALMRTVVESVFSSMDGRPTVNDEAWTYFAVEQGLLQLGDGVGDDNAAASRHTQQNLLVYERRVQQLREQDGASDDAQGNGLQGIPRRRRIRAGTGDASVATPPTLEELLRFLSARPPPSNSLATASFSP